MFKKRKLLSGLLQGLLGTVLTVILGLAFLENQTITGTFHADEVGVVLGSISNGRELSAIFREAAYTAQPPLDHILRERVLRPIGDQLKLSQAYPELTPRLFSALWWFLPLGLFISAFSKYSEKNRLTISLALILILSSKFLGYYLAEARHYSAIAAVFASMLIIWMQDLTSWDEKKYRFLVVASLLPFLHMVSFPYWLLIVVAFFVNLFKNSHQSKKRENYLLLGSYLILAALVLVMYLKIKEISSDWQHPATTNLNLSYLGSYLKWTIDWIFYGTFVYKIWDIVPTIVKNNLLPLFGALAFGGGIYGVKNYLLQKRKGINLFLALYFIIFSIWPLNVLTFLYVSGMFTGERYSIAILVIIMFCISYVITELLWKITSNTTTRTRIGWGIISVISAGMIISFLPKSSWKLSSDENEFIKQNRQILEDPNVILLGDTGGYSSAIPLLASLNNVQFKVQYSQCRFGTFHQNEKNVIEQWLNKHKNKTVLLLGTKQDFMAPNKILWSRDDLALYQLDSINKSGLCNNQQTFNECYLKCFKGKYPAASDDRSIPGTAPHLDIHRP